MVEEQEQEYEDEIEEAEKEEEEEAIGKQIIVIVEKDIAVLELMDSMHNYLSLLHSLSSTLSHAWMDLATARLSMGSSRINSLLFHLHPHSAPTTTSLFSNPPQSPRFTLRKWLSSSSHPQFNQQHNNHKPQLDTNTFNSPELTVARDFSGPANDDEEEVRKERSKSLSVFGILISPKLRDAQLSFEKALETLVEIANMRSSLLYSFHQLHQDAEDTKE